MKIQALVLSAALVVPLTLVAQNTPNNSSNNNSNMPSHLSSQDHQFLKKIACEDQSEINLARLALQKTNDAQVQHYAQSKILAADPSMEQNAKQIAQKDNKSISATPSQADKTEYNHLSMLSGKAFNKAYMNYESRKQGSDLNMVNNEMASTSNPQIKNYLQKEKGPVQKASQSAKQISQSMPA